ncbi:MAG: putative chitinase [Candidatus Accumulibacter regalis]|uniref:Chitinase n=2 Tax=Candidatus Accumulibacter TaxID=327159 RepID=A0A011QKN5_ACCRE|nr:MAG: putative chitinase [Candidatus Accumulibacter regalis]
MLANGASAAWALGARVWLSIPADLADASAGLTQLSFVLGVQGERLGSEAGAAQVWRPSFSGDRGWTLQAHADEARSGADRLQRQGDRLYAQDSGLPWVPRAYTLTAPDGTRYTLDAQGTINGIAFADGQSWLVSDAGIAAVNGDFAERVDFQRDSAGHIVRLTAPDGAGGTTAIAYRYDSAGRLILVRRLDDGDPGTPIAYAAGGQVLTDPLTAYLGAAVRWGSSDTNAWAGELNADTGINLAFSVRESEIESTIHAPGAQGAVILALETMLPADARLEVVGAQTIGSTTVNGTHTRLLRVSEAGVKLIRISGNGAAQLRISVAGDLDRDGRIDAADSQAWEQAASAQDRVADINGDGRMDSADRQVLYANYGFRANRAPTAANTANGASAVLNTHTDLATRGALSKFAEDLEGDTLFWRVLGSSHGSGRIEADGQTLSFTPEAGYSGAATLTLQADDGFAAGAPLELTIDVSGASLLRLHLAQLPALASGQFARLQASADFADEQSVAITDAAYLTLGSADLTELGGRLPNPLQVDDTHDIVRATGVGPALLMIQRVDNDGRLVQAAAAINVRAAALPFDREAGAEENESASGYGGDESLSIEPDVYPGTLTLMPGDTRQLKVRLPDPYSDQPIDIHTASQTNFSGAPETLESYLDPESGEGFDIVIPATPPVYSGTRYVVSDASIASLGEDGLITALRPGEVSVAIVHLASVVDRYGGVSDQVIGQSTIRLRVQAAALTDDDPNTAAPAGITIAADQGGVVQAATGETVMIGAGALRDDALVSIRRIAVAELLAETGMSAPEPEVLQTLAAFRLDLGEQASSVPVQLAIPLQAEVGVEVGDEVLFLRRGTAPDVNGILQDKWWLLDNGFVGTDAQGRLVARTASPPYGGVSASGDLVVVKTRSNHETGALTVRGNGVNVFALTTNSLAISLAGNLANGGLTGAGAATNLVGMFAGRSEIYAINLDFGGVYQVVPVQRSLDNGELTLTIATPGESGSGTRDTGTSPRITDVKMLAAGKLQLTVEDLQPAAVPGMAAQASALRVWISPDEPKVDPYGKASSAVWRNDSQEMRDGMRLWQKVVDLEAVAPGAARMTVDIDLPPQLALGLHVITVQRMLQSVDPANPGATRWLANGEAGHVALAGQTDFSVVTLANRMQIFRNGEIVKEIPYLDANGDPTVGGGSKTDQIAFSLDNRLVFVAGAHGTIHVIDTATMSATTSFSVGTVNVSSLAVSGQWLYVAEGGPYDPAGNYRLLRVNIDETASDFLAIRQVELPAAVSGQNAPYGYIDMALTHGAHSYLALTASKQSIDVAMARSQPDSGNVFILDLDQLQERSGRLAATGAGAFVQVDFPTREGKGPQYIASAGIKGNTLRLLLSDALDDNAGLATITVELSNSGRLQGAPVFRQIPMSGALPGMSRLDGNYQLNIQRAQSPAVIVARNGSEYALVADYFFDFVDSLYALDEPQNGARQAGGKIGIVKNPFAAAPEYLGATSPIIDANFSRLQVTDGGRTLWADIRYWPTIGEAPPASGLLVWDLDALIAAAERNSLARQASPRPLPIDRQRIDGVTTQVVTPSKLNLADSPQLTSGWIHGMATSQLLQPDAVEFTAPVDGGQFLRTTIAPDAGGKVPEINYGDVARVDLFKLIRDEYASTLADLNDADFNINWENIEVGGAAQLVRDGQGFLLTAEREDGFTSAQAATNATYSGLQAVGTDLGKKTLRDSGIVFLAPKIDVDRLRQGRTLPSADITLSLKGYDRNDPEKRLLLRLRVVDYTRAAETVFFGDRPLNNPGYHPFAGAAGLSARPGAENDLLDVWRVEQRLKYLGFGLSAMNTGEITVNGTIDDAEHIALRQFDQIIDGKTTYATTLTEQITVGGRASTRTTPLPPVTLSERDVAWLNAYNAPHWLDFFPSGSQQLVGWEDMTDKTNPTAAMGTSWIYDLMLSAQDAATAQGRPYALWFNGTGSLGTMLNLGINERYVSLPNQTAIDGDEWLFGLRSDNGGITAALNTGTWNYTNALALSELLQNPNRRRGVTDPENPLINGRGINNQMEALRDFLAVYASVRTDEVSGNGSLDEQVQRVRSGSTPEEQLTIHRALFGDGTSAGGIINNGKLLLGGLGDHGGGIGSQLTAESLAAIMGSTAARMATWVDPLNEAMQTFEISTPKRIAAFLANVRKETRNLQVLSENTNWNLNAVGLDGNYTQRFRRFATANAATIAAYQNQSADNKADYAYFSPANGNTETDDGHKYKGRGLLQLTWKNNYRRATVGLNLVYGPETYDLITNFQSVTTNSVVAARTAAWFWHSGSSRGNLNSIVDRSETTDERNFQSTVLGIRAGEDPQRLGIWRSINDVIYEENSFGNMGKVLEAIGIPTEKKTGYNTQFGISLRKKEIQETQPNVARLLLAPTDTGSNAIELGNAEQMVPREFYLQTGEIYMLPPEIPSTEPSQTSFTPTAQVIQSNSNDLHDTIGVCHLSPSAKQISIQNDRNGYYALSVRLIASSIFADEPHLPPQLNVNYENAEVITLEQPKHGRISKDLSPGRDISYYPDANYTGNDRVSFLVTIEGTKVKLVYFIKVDSIYDITTTTDPNMYRKNCPHPNPWRIPRGSDTNKYDKLPLAIETTLDVFSTGFSFEPLAGATLALLTGDGKNIRITLNESAAGYGWFVDLTPSDNAEFLPTSNPFELIARPGSDAEGRMDLLTVLRHEYGHAAGLEHSGDSHDLMASTLLPGVRRLPTSSELAALHGLLAGTNSAPLPYDPSTPPGAPLPLSRSVGSLRLSRLRPAETNDPAGDTLSAAIAQFSIAANPTLLDAGFIDGSAWSTSGEVVFTQGAATLREAASSQTRLNQAFVVGANDGTLSFTLADIALDDVDAAPDDAFEVALIDASTGQSLMGGSGLANSDAIFNLQADGSEHRAAGVTTLHNADGGVSVVVDLTGIAPGTVVNLSFDLIGFGRGAAAVSSQVTVRDLRLGGGQALAARDDEATTAEDTPLRIAVLDNDSGVQSGDEIGSETSGIVPVLVDGPLHGKVAVNGDGSFTYSPQADWNGTDRFAYRLLGKEVESNIATVRVIVTPVNDAPTLSAGGLQATYADEDFTLELRSSDPDDDRINGWQIDWGDGQIVDIDGNPGQVSHRYSGVLGEVLIRATAVDDDGRYALDPLAVTILPPPLQVTSFSYDHGGFTVRFNDVFEAGRINLYDSALTGLGAADIVLIGSAGVVSGSLVVDADYRGLRYLVGGNGLLADTYRLTLRSGPQAFHSAWSDLDGNGDGDIVPGDDFRTSFTLDAVPATQLALPDFMRGPGQAVNVPAAGQHLPLTLLSPGEVRQLSFVIRFDPALLEISAALPGSGLPADAVLKIDRPLRGELRVNIETATAIAAGTVTLLDLVASVPATAPYGTQQVLDIQQVSINAQSLAGADRDGLQSVGYGGDTNGNGTWEKADLALISRLALQADNGFAAWSRIDPLLVADVDSDHRITSADVSAIGQNLHDLQWPQGAKAPTGLSLTFAEPQAWPGQPQIDFGAPFAGFTFGSDDPRYRRDNWKLSFVTQLAGKTVNPNSRLQVTLDSSPQATRSA